MRKIFDILKSRKRFILFTVLKALIMVLGLVTNIFIIRKLSVGDYGMFSVALMFVGLLTTLGFSWSSSSIIYYGSKEKEKYGSINKTFWARNIIIFISLVVMSIFFIVFKNSINNYIGIDVAYLLLVWLFISVIEDYLSQHYLAVKKQILSSLLSITAKVIYILLMLIFDFDVKTLIILNIVSHASVLMYILGINKNDVSKFEFDKKWFKEILNFSLWQFFGFSGLYLINFGDTAVIKHFMSIEDVGIYNAAYKLFNAVANFAFVISSYYAASMSQFFVSNNTQQIKKFYYKERFLIFGVSIVVHLIIMMFSKHIITFLYGNEYSDAVLIFNILMIGSLARYLAVFYTLYYNTNKKYKVLQYINIFRAIINIILDIILIQVFGIIGPAIATTIALITTFLFSVYYCEKRILKIVKNDVD